MNSMARRGGITTEEMMQLAKDEDVDLDHLIRSRKWFYHIIPNTQSVALIINSWLMTLLGQISSFIC